MLAFDLGIYNWIKTFHVLAAIVWVGGGIFIQIYVTRLKRANDQAKLMAFAKDVEKLGTTYQPDEAPLPLTVDDLFALEQALEDAPTPRTIRTGSSVVEPVVQA